jgi:hypothetical protein
MDDKELKQLVELSKAFKKIDLKPVICGGFAVYLSFYNRPDEPLRITNDIDLMLTKSQLLEQNRRKAIAEIITGELEYIACAGGEYFRFKKEPDQRLDILAQPMDELKIHGERLRIVKSKLHGRITPEACFIEEDLRIISLSDLLLKPGTTDKIEIAVPSPTNLLILKLCAFHDRHQGTRQDVERAQTHAWDIYTIITLSDRNDYLQGQSFLSRHKQSDIIQKVTNIVFNSFSSIDKTGWQRLLETNSFHPNLKIQRKRGRLDEAGRRLVRWFTVSS